MPEQRKPRARRKSLVEAAPVPAAPAFIYRDYQQAARDAFVAGRRRQFLAWHRRAGKDAYAMQRASEEMKLRVGNYWHLFPLHSHARRALWEGVDHATGIRFIDRYFPEHEREHVNTTEMLIRMKNGSTWQLLGSDHYDRLVGAGTIGISVSEWALCDPRFYEYARPIIRENNGWILFITTFRGRNHAWQQFQQLKNNPEWYCDLRTIRDTKREDGSPVISERDVQKDRDEGMSESLVQQEYFCNPAAALPGSVYGGSVNAIMEGGRAGTFAHDARYPVVAAWSLEFAPVNVSVAFFQPVSNQLHCIGSRSWMFTELADAVAQARSEFRWRPAAHVVPPDDDGVYSDLFADLGLWADPAPKLPVSKAVLVSQAMLSRLHIDHVARPFERTTALNNELLIDSLNGYRLRESSDSEEFTLNSFVSFERYLSRAVEHFAAWDRMIGRAAAWEERDYSRLDRAVI